MPAQPRRAAAASSGAPSPLRTSLQPASAPPGALLLFLLVACVGAALSATASWHLLAADRAADAGTGWVLYDGAAAAYASLGALALGGLGVAQGVFVARGRRSAHPTDPADGALGPVGCAALVRLARDDAVLRWPPGGYARVPDDAPTPP